VDADPQGSLAHLFGVPPRHTLEDLLLGAAPPASVIAPHVRPGLDLIAATPSAFLLETRLSNQPDRELCLRRRLEPIRGYDTVVLDCSPAMTVLSYNALMYAHELVVPVGMDAFAIAGATQTLRGVQQIAALWPEHPLRLTSLLPIAVNAKTHATRAALAALDRDPLMAAHVFRPGIRQCLDLTYAAAQRQTIWEYAPRSKAAADYAAFVDFVQACGDPAEAITGGPFPKETEAVLRTGDHHASAHGGGMGLSIDAGGFRAG
jgi:chromosome partitioning protein